MTTTAARTIARLDAGGRVAHKEKRMPYAYGSNREWVRDQARKPGVIGMDIDTTVSLEGTPWWNHWLRFIGQDAWFDPRHLLGNHAVINHTHDAALRRVRVHYQGTNRPMLTAAQAALFCHTVKGGPLIPCFEAKFQFPQFFNPEWYREHFIPMQDKGQQPVIMTLRKQHSHGLGVMEAAHEAGLPTMWLWRPGDPTDAVLRKHGVALVKSKPHRGIYRIA